MNRRFSAILLTLLLNSALTLTFNVHPAKSESEGFDVITSENMTFSLRDHKSMSVPIGHDPRENGGFLLTDYPYSNSASLATGLWSPYALVPTYVYNYTDDSSRTLQLYSPYGWGGTCPGDITPATRDDETYLLTANKFWGQGSWHDYQGGDISWPFSTIIDYPDFTNMTSLNLVLPAAELGYSLGQALWIERSWSLDGHNLWGYGAVSSYMGNTPKGKYLYHANLTDPQFLDVTKVHEIYHINEISWDSPIKDGFYYKVSDNVLFHVRWALDTDNYVFYNLMNGSWKAFTAKGWNVVWNKIEGNYLYLLLQHYEGYDKYILNRVNLVGIDNLEMLTTNPVETLWEKTFHKDYENYYPIHMVRDNRLFVFEGSSGYPTEWGPILDSVSIFGLPDGEEISTQDLNIRFPYASAYLRDVQYPFSDGNTIYGSFIVNLDKNLIYAINLTDIVDYIGDETGLDIIGYMNSFFITDYDLSKANLLGIIYNYTSRSAHLISIDIARALNLIPGDINQDGIVDISDAIMASHSYGSSPDDHDWNPLTDLDGNGTVDIFDMIRLAAMFGHAR